VERDQKMTEHAFNTFQELVKRFPLSPYAKDAKLKLDLTSEFLAGGFMDIGRFYQIQYLPISAVNRFREVIKKYETTSHVPEALYRLIETYLQLGIEKEAQAAAVVLGHNFPGSSWYKLGYELLASKNLLPKSKSEFKIRKAWEQPANAAQSNHP
jgi:outer membrane protein assembly factor BamD